MVKKPTLTLAMIVRDEAVNLPRSLGPIHDRFDQVVVVDTGSKDRTPLLAREYGADVLSVPWREDFAQARNISIEAAIGDWILWLDADNGLEPADVERLRTFLPAEGRAVIWCVEVVVPAGEKLGQKRIFPRHPEVRFSGRVHEQLVHPADFRQIITPIEIKHWGYADREAARVKGQRNLTLLSAMAAVDPEDPYVSYQLGRTLNNLRRFEEALPWLRRSAAANWRATNPGLFGHAHGLLAQVLERLGRQQEAEATLMNLLDQAPDYGPGHLWLGRIRAAQGRHVEAIRALETGLKLGLGDPASGLNPAILGFTAAMLLGRSRETSDSDQAGQAYRMARDFNPSHPEPILALARLARKAGRREEAGRYLEECRRLAPDSPRVAALLSEAGLHA